MKKICVLLLFVAFSVVLYAQADNVRPGSIIPSFRMLMTNGKYFSEKEIQKNKPFVLIYFAPDCDHCIKLMDDLFKKIHQFDQATLVIMTFKPVGDLPSFEKKYQVARFPNIKVGTEGLTYVVRNFYRLDKTPFVAVYNKKGKLAFTYRNQPEVNEMLSQYKKI